MLKRILIVLVLLFLCSSTIMASSRLRDLVFVPLTPANTSHIHGYIENRIKITNESYKKRYKVRLVAPGNAYPFSGGNNILKKVERSFIIDPQMTVYVSLPVPPVTVYGSKNMRVYVNGADWGTVDLPSLTTSRSGQKVPSILTSRSINGQALGDMFKKKLFPKQKKYDQKYIIRRSELELDEWSTSWLAYSCYDVVMLHADDIPMMSDSLREALRQYVSVGGAVIIMGTSEYPFGWGTMPIDTTDSYSSRQMGFGDVALIKTADIKELSNGQMLYILSVANDTLDAWRNPVSMATANKSFPVIDNISFPVRGMFFLMLVFAIVIGPVTLIILAKKNKRMWLLWIVPAISLSTCIVVFIYSLFSDGITPTVRRESLTLLNQKTHQATTIGMLGLYCPLAPSGGLHFNTAAEMSSYITERSSSGSAKSIDWTRDQHFLQGWISARIPAYFRVRIPEIRRERLDIVQGNNKMEVINGLGAEVKQLWVCDAEDNWFTIKDALVEGGKCDLLKRQVSNKGINIKLRDIYSATDWSVMLKQMVKNRKAVLYPGMYLAVLDDAPFIKHGLHGRVHNKSVSYVLGTFSSQSDATAGFNNEDSSIENNGEGE